jgi:hypothetical protein
MEDCLEDAKFFEHIWHELERKGYLKTHIYPDGEGGFQCEYTLLEEADVDGGAYCYEHDADGVVIATNLGEKKHK